MFRPLACSITQSDALGDEPGAHELKTGLGLDHFEGRSWTGWHRHVTLVTAAQLFCTMLRLDPTAAAPA
jgi:SRSO17 transposase